ncbi:hypothetical protein FACS189445_2580 [Spirochaetia bacterium]|nr:hypothetical protein FACS189445_2580 [Spirochaetia bacterium]
MTEDDLIKNYLNDMQYVKKIKDFYDNRELTFQILDLSDLFFTIRFLIDLLEYGPEDQSEKL